MKTVKLGDVCEFRRGLTYKKSDEVEKSNNVVLRATNIDIVKQSLNLAELKYINDSVIVPKEKCIEVDSILICTASGSRSHLGKVAYINTESNYAFGGFMGLIVPNREVIEGKYLFKLMISQSFRKLIDSLMDGTNINNLKFSDFKNFEFILPTLEEQRRVVERLDAAFEKIDRAIELSKSNTIKANSLIDRLIDKEIEKSLAYEKNTMGDVCKFVRGPFGGSLKKEYFKPSGYAVYEQRQAIYDSFDKFRYFIDEKKFIEMQRFEVKADDIIMSCSGTMGKIAIVPKNAVRGVINQALLKLSPDKNNLTSKFLKYWMESTTYQEFLNNNSGGAAIKNVASVKILKTIPIYLPSLELQNEITGDIDKLKIKKSELGSKYDKKYTNLLQLKQSMLQQAFSGDGVQ